MTELIPEPPDDLLNNTRHIAYALPVGAEGEWREVLRPLWEWGYRRGADDELEACCQWLQGAAPPSVAARLLAARRPKPLTDKEQALASLEVIRCDLCFPGQTSGHIENIRRALEALPDD